MFRTKVISLLCLFLYATPTLCMWGKSSHAVVNDQTTAKKPSVSSRKLCNHANISEQKKKLIAGDKSKKLAHSLSGVKFLSVD